METLQDRISFIGTGGVFDYKIGNSAAIIKVNKGNILIDCGYTVYPILAELRAVEMIDYILITHLHGDHIGSIHPLILELVNKYKKKVKIIFPTDAFLKELRNYFKMFLISLDRYVEFVNINEMQDIGYKETTNYHVKNMQSFSYYFQYNDAILFYSGDVGSLTFLQDFVSDWKEKKQIICFHETSFLKGNAHVYYRDLQDFISKTQTKVFAYHCNHKKAPKDCTLLFVGRYPELCLQKQQRSML